MFVCVLWDGPMGTIGADNNLVFLLPSMETGLPVGFNFIVSIHEPHGKH